MYPHLRFHIVSFLVILCIPCVAQVPARPEFHLTLIPENCDKGAAYLSVSGPVQDVQTHWSTGEVNTIQIKNLSGGEHNVSVHVKYKRDTLLLTKDTTLFFTLEKQECAVGVAKFFSPNDDQHNDLLSISNLQYYPNFELSIFNKWGQRVHFQRHTYEPWDGTWLGAHLPDGTYYYVLFYDESNKKHFVRGDITILR
jgi:gliding motility-associated-like protein